MFAKAREIQRRRRMADGENGFTLIELLIVIVVLGILAAIVVFALGGVTGQSAVAACTSDAKTVSVAVSAFEANNNGTAPTAPTYAADGTISAQSNLVTGDSNNVTYLKSWPLNSSYYLVSLNAGDVTVALNTKDTNATGVPTTSPLATGFTAAELYEGSSAYTLPTGNANVGQGICAGA